MRTGAHVFIDELDDVSKTLRLIHAVEKPYIVLPQGQHIVIILRQELIAQITADRFPLILRVGPPLQSSHENIVSCRMREDVAQLLTACPFWSLLVPFGRLRRSLSVLSQREGLWKRITSFEKRNTTVASRYELRTGILQLDRRKEGACVRMWLLSIRRQRHMYVYIKKI